MSPFEIKSSSVSLLVNFAVFIKILQFGLNNTVSVSFPQQPWGGEGSGSSAGPRGRRTAGSGRGHNGEEEAGPGDTA